MIKYLLVRLKSSRQFWLSTLFIFVVMIGDLCLLLGQSHNLNANFMAFLSGASHGHYAQRLLLWLAPIYLMMGPSAWSGRDADTGYSFFVLPRTTRWHWFGSRTVFVMVVEFLRWTVLLSVDYLFCLVFEEVRGGLGGYDSSIFSDNAWLWLQWQLHHQLTATLISILITGMTMAVMSALVSSLGIIFENTRYQLFISFLIWFVFLIGNTSLLNFSQPFSDFAVTSALLGEGLFLLITGLTAAWAGKRVLHDDAI